MAQHFEWESDNSDLPFDLVIFGDEALYNETVELSKTRTINERVINPKFLKTSNQKIKADLIYINQSYGYNAHRILKLINQENILLIGENYQYNECMINLLNISEDFYYELNNEKLKSHSFIPSVLLSEHSISSASKWFDLYKESQAYLASEKDKSQKKSDIIDQQQDNLTDLQYKISALHEIIERLNDDIESQTNELNNLNKKTLIQTNEINLNLELIRDLENKIANSKSTYSNQIKQYDSLNIEIAKQKRVIENQSSKILEKSTTISAQENILSSQSIKLKTQERINVLLLCVLTLIIFIGYLVIRSYLKERRLNRLLQIKNLEITDRNNEIEQFSYIASHDLQAPLNTIIGFIDLLEFKLKKKLDDDDVVNMKFIKGSSERMKRLIKDLLEYSQIGETKKEVFNINNLLKDVFADLKLNHPSSNAKISIDNPEDLSINGLYTDIRLLFQNLISNALKFSDTESNSIINISINQKRGSKAVKTTFHVEDNGIGIEEEYRSKVFDVFTRLHNDSMYEGTGIGLAHCKKIVTRHHGKIWIEDSSLGGTKFCFTIVELLS